MKSPTLGAVILAAGRGQRMAGERPKAYLPLHGKPILRHSVEKFSSYKLLNELILVIHPDDQNLLEREILNQLQLPSHLSFEVIEGGAVRQDSSLAGVGAATADWLFVHDAARPLFTMDLLPKLFEAAQAHQAAIPTLPIVDSLRRIDAEQQVVEDIRREGIHLVQTPQCFERESLLNALERASQTGSVFTDEAAALLAMSNVRAKAVEGTRANFKITTPWDLRMAELILQYPDLLG